MRILPEKMLEGKKVKDFVATVNKYRMSMGPAITDLAKPILDLTEKDAKFERTKRHTIAVKGLKHHLINYTPLRIHHPKKAFVSTADASGYAV